MDQYRLYPLLGALSLAVLCYLPGLWGPFLLDDFSNLDRLSLWLKGNLQWQGIIFGNESGPLGRPLSMATFLANASLSGLNPWWFKATNLLIHLACGVLVAGFARHLIMLDERLRPHADKIAILLALWWLLLPVHSATVLYVIQRMAQLSTLFIFAGLWMYLAARQQIERGRRGGIWMLFLGVPVLTAAGALAKENALLLPLLCGLLEFGMYRGRYRSQGVRWFLWLAVALPVLAAVIFVLFNPGFVLSAFERRDFTLIERLLTQARVLWNYVLYILVPAGSGLSLFQDNVELSTGLLRPWTTLAAIAAWAGVLAGAFAAWRSAPLILTGLLLYLGGHLMESSVFALELAFLHRNYMPSVGILIVVIGLVGLAARHLPAPTPEFRRIGLVLLFLAGAVLWSASFARSWVWQSENALVAYELEHNPNSVRGRLMAAELAVRADETNAVLYQIEEAEKHLSKRERGTASIWRMAAFCGAGRRIPGELVQEFRQRADGFISPLERKAFDSLTNHLERESCPLDNLTDIAKAGRDWLEASTQEATATSLWRFRYDVARLLARSGNLEDAFSQAERAFHDSGCEFPVGVLAFQLASSMGDRGAAQRVLALLEANQDPHDRRHQRTIEGFGAYLRGESNSDSPQ